MHAGHLHIFKSGVTLEGLSLLRLGLVGGKLAVPGILDNSKSEVAPEN